MEHFVVNQMETADGDLIVQEDYRMHIITRGNAVYTTSVAALSPYIISNGPLKPRRIKGEFRAKLIDLPRNIRKQVDPACFFIGKITWKGIPYYLFRYQDTVKMIGAEGVVRKYTLNNDLMRWVGENEYALIRASGGVDLFDEDHQEKPVRYFSNYIIQDILRDREHNLWFATKGSGVFKVNNSRFKNLFTINDNGASYIRDIRKIGASIYIGDQNDRYWKCDAVKESFFTGVLQIHPGVFFSGPSFLKQLPDKTFFYCGSSDFLNLKQFKVKNLKIMKTVMLYQDTLILADFSSAYIYNTKKRTLHILHSGRSTCVYRQNSNYYIGTLEGLYEIDTQQHKRFLGQDIPELRDHISYFAESEDGTLWVGTYSNGVIGYREGRVVANFNRRTGLSSDVCRCLFVAKNTLWVGTEKGLNKIDISPGVYKVTRKITAEDGLNSNIINAVCNDGQIVYVGTPFGVTVFDERNIPDHTISEIRMTGITVSGRSIDLTKKEISLKHEENNIAFEFSGISFLSEGDMTYKYRILGLDNRWKTTREHILSYPSLPSGNYRLELIAVNKFNDKSTPLEFSFTIRQSMAETVWFKLTAALLAAGAIIIVVRFITRRQHRKETQDLMMEQKISSLEQMALRAQMNPHFIFNCLNSMQAYILDGDVIKANFYLASFAGLVRETLDNASKVFITLNEEISYLTNYIELERLQLEETFEYAIHVAPHIAPDRMMIPNMVLQPYVENAIKHGLSQGRVQGRLTIAFMQQDQILVCTVEDNGPGIRQRQDTGGERRFPANGMAITHKRIHTLNQLHLHGQPIAITISDLAEEGTGTGTRIVIHFPIYYDQGNNYR